MKIGVVIGSVRQGRKGESVARWFVESLLPGEVDVEVVDLAAFDIPIVTSATLPAMAGKVYDSPNVQAFSAAIDSCDGFVFVTPEYNHGVPGAFKNAVDSLGSEWQGKAVGFVSYGAAGGIRAVEQWRQIVANFSMDDVRAQVVLSLFTDFDEDGVISTERNVAEARSVFDDVVAATARTLA